MTANDDEVMSTSCQPATPQMSCVDQQHLMVSDVLSQYTLLQGGTSGDEQQVNVTEGQQDLSGLRHLGVHTAATVGSTVVSLKIL
jgi:hypothetical protein